MTRLIYRSIDYILDKINITYGPSYGPGGHQVYTKVIVKFHVESADWINPELKQRLLQGVRLGFQIITCENYSTFIIYY